MDITEKIKIKAVETGFDLASITTAEPVNNQHRKLFKKWLDNGFAGEMHYMHRNFSKRINSAELLENAQSVIVVGLNYNPIKQNDIINEPAGKVANYAQYEDYHQFIKKLLRELTHYIDSLTESRSKFKICVDSVPLAERALAVRAGLGFIGKNHMLTNPRLGNQILLGEIITTLKLQPDKPIKENCSSCSKCIKACPTQALMADGQFDATRCISYLTIEHKSRIAADLEEKIGNKIFGCDECAIACPYQQKAPVCKNNKFKFYGKKVNLSLKKIMDMSQEDFEKKFADSPIKRPGLDRLKRNAKICMVNQYQ